MANRTDLSRLFHLAQGKGLSATEVYAERFYCAVIEHSDRSHETRLLAGQGVCVRGQRGEVFVEELGDETPADLPSPGKPLPAEALSTLKTLQRSLGELSLPRPAKWRLISQARSFAVAHEPDASTAESEEAAQVSVEWLGADGKIHRDERCRSTLTALLDDLAGPNPFLDSIRRTLSRAEPWPAPRGDCPVHWSQRAVAKICLPFLRAFEGDRVHRSRSFLASISSPLGFSFSVEDAPELKFDHEGAPTKRTAVFDGDTPRNLFVDQALARLLGVQPNGHCRRDSFRSMATVGFWHPRLEGKRATTGPLGGLNWGLSVRDLEVLDFDLTSGRIRLSLDDTKLIHHGQEGEAIAPILLETNLLDLLRSLSAFSTDSRTTGFHVPKMGQTLPTEISTPSALSERVPIPGQVPLQYYW